MEENVWLVAGLGNPGAEYADTRHNAGFGVADIVAREVRANFWKSECGSLAAHREWEGLDVIVAKPQSFMNLSGAPVVQLMKRYGVPKERLVVVHDDLDLPDGTVRVKFGSGHGGQNGVRSIIDKLGSKSFYQVKVGIGRPPGRMPVSDYVLSAPRGEAKEAFLEGVSTAAEAVLFFLQNGIQKTQSRFN